MLLRTSRSSRFHSLLPPSASSRLKERRLISSTFVTMSFLSTTLFLAYSLLSLTQAAPAPAASSSSSAGKESLSSNGDYWRGGNRNVANKLQDVLAKAHQGPLYDYPTSLTQGIFPRPLHSHNDYWRPVPLYTAISYGCVSIESDVWLYNDTLYVGHHEEALTKQRTFKSLYVDPLLDILKKQNPKSEFGQTNINGVWDTASSQTTYLFVDVKTEGTSTWAAVLKAIEPLKANGYLSSANATTFTNGAITIVGTGNTPRQAVESAVPRHVFYDAPLATLNATNITALVSPIASTNFQASLGPVLGSGLNATQLEQLRGQIGVAAKRGIKARYWNQPDFPILNRNEIWRQLFAEGVGLLNVDDLESASGLGVNVW